MSSKNLNFSSQLYDYLLKNSLRDHEVLTHLREINLQHEAGIMQIAPEQGQFLGFVLQLIQAKRVLELGTFTGYSALAMALALPDDGEVITCDCDPRPLEIAKSHWEQAGMTHKIQMKLGDAEDSLKTLSPESFDFIFLDADKTRYPLYYELCLPLLRRGGLMALDNVFLQGKVWDEACQTPSVQALRQLNESILNDTRVDLTMLPLADGLTLVRKR